MAGNKWKGKEWGNKKETEDLSSIQNKNNGRRKLGKVIIHTSAVIPHFHFLSLFQSTDWLMGNKPVLNNIT
jgi:hypothetical protein